jgi:hypothetical protein
MARACIASPIDRDLPKLQPSALGYVAERFPVPSRPDNRSRVALYRTEVERLSSTALSLPDARLMLPPRSLKRLEALSP